MRRLFAISLLLFLFGCVGEAPARPDIQNLAPGVTLALPDSSPFGESGDVLQLVQARYGNQHQTFQSIIEIAPQRFTVLMTVPSGPRIMRVDWIKDAITQKKELIAPANLSAERMLADLMLVYAPEDVLRAALEGGVLAVTSDGTRKVLKNGRELIVIRRPIHDPWAGHAALSNLAYDYALDIQSQRVGP